MWDALENSPTKDAKIPPENTNPPFEHGPILTPPPVPRHDTSDASTTKVDTGAMRAFAQNLASMAAPGSPLRQAWADLDDVNIKPGGFISAEKLRKAVQGDGQLRAATQHTVKVMLDALLGMSDAVTQMAAHYESVEEANKMDAAEYQGYVGRVSGQISGMNNSGVSA